MARHWTEETWNLPLISNWTLFRLDFVEDLHLKSIWSWKCPHDAYKWIQKTVHSRGGSGPASLSNLKKTELVSNSQCKHCRAWNFQYTLYTDLLGDDGVTTHEKTNLLTEHLQTRLRHRNLIWKPHAVHSVTVFYDFKSVLLCALWFQFLS